MTHTEPPWPQWSRRHLESYCLVVRLSYALRQAERVSRLWCKYLKTLSAFSLVVRNLQKSFQQSRQRAPALHRSLRNFRMLWTQRPVADLWIQGDAQFVLRTWVNRTAQYSCNYIKCVKRCAPSRSIKPKEVEAPKRLSYFFRAFCASLSQKIAPEILTSGAISKRVRLRVFLVTV